MGSCAFTMAKDISSDDEFNKHFAANKFVLAIFMESDTEMEANLTDLSKMLKTVSYIKVPRSKTPNASAEYDIADHELPTFIFLEDTIEMDKLATGLSYIQLNGSGVDTEKLGNQIKIVFRM